MIDLKDYPTKEDFVEGILRCTAECREVLNDVEYLCKRYVDGDYFMTEEQVAELLHCDIENIPKMSYYRSYDRRDDNKYKRYYKRIDVNNLLASRRIEIKN